MRENVRTVLKVYQSIAAKDAEAIAALSDPQIVVEQSEELPWGGTYHGLAECMAFFRRVSETLNSRVIPEMTLDAGDYVAVVGRTEGSVRQSGRDFSVRLVHLWRVQGGRVAALHVLLHNPDMLAALGSDSSSSRGK